MSKEQIEVITYEQDRLYFFVDQVSLAQKKYDRLFKTFKDAPYLSEGAQFLSDAGRELQFYKDVVEMLDKGYRKQEWFSVDEKLPSESGKYIVCTKRGNVYQTKFYSYPENKGGHWGQKDKGRSITHWMLLPEAPRSEKG